MSLHPSTSSFNSLITIFSKSPSRTLSHTHRNSNVNFAAPTDTSRTAAEPLPVGYVRRIGARTVFDMPPIKETVELSEVEQGLFNDLMAAVREVI